VRTLAFSIAIYSLFTALQGLSQGILDFAVYRFIAGLGTGAELMVGIPLLAETLCDTALRIERRFESAVRGTRWDWLLWTQYFLALKPGALSQAMRCAGRSERAVES